MAWFKKSDEEDTHMMNGNLSGRSGADQPIARPEPREPRVEARTAAQRAFESKSTEARPAEVRTPEVRIAEVAPPRASVLGPTLRFRGELSAQEDLIIQGSVEGSITHTQSLTIGTDGTVKGDIRARVIIVDGKVDGDLFATESVHIRATAKVKGNVIAPRVAIQDGAFFQGKVDMQATGAAVQEHTARLRQAAMHAPAQDEVTADKVLSGT
jgi:cytoskeletal protein CcmA (bactofilin family)